MQVTLEIRVFRELIADDAQVDMQSINGISALIAASQEGQVRKGCSIRHAKQHWIIASQGHNIEVVRKLIAMLRADLECQRGGGGGGLFFFRVCKVFWESIELHIKGHNTSEFVFP